MCFLTNRASQLSFIRCLFLFMKMSRSAFSGRSRFLKSVHTKPAVLVKSFSRVKNTRLALEFQFQTNMYKLAGNLKSSYICESQLFGLETVTTFESNCNSLR